MLTPKSPKRLAAERNADFEFVLTVVDRGNTVAGMAVVDVQVDSHHHRLGTQCLMVGQDLRPEVADALAAAFARPVTSCASLDRRPPAAEAGAA